MEVTNAFNWNTHSVVHSLISPLLSLRHVRLMVQNICSPSHGNDSVFIAVDSIWKAGLSTFPHEDQSVLLPHPKKLGLIIPFDPRRPSELIELKKRPDPEAFFVIVVIALMGGSNVTECFAENLLHLLDSLTPQGSSSPSIPRQRLNGWVLCRCLKHLPTYKSACCCSCLFECFSMVIGSLFAWKWFLRIV
jgi:hypothetical protein